MKKNIILFTVIFVINFAYSQQVGDAIRFAQEDLTGTARFRSMSGAFGAIGGDLSAINVNPAGAAVFENNQFGFSITSQNMSNKSNYLETNTKENANNFLFNQLGSVFVFKNKSADWKKIAFGINFENTNNFYNSQTSVGYNSKSIDNYFLSYANHSDGGFPVDLELLKIDKQNNEDVSSLYAYLGGLPNRNYPQVNGFGAQQAFLGYQAYVINPVDQNANNLGYVSNVPKENKYYQENYKFTRGYTSKLAFNASTSYKDKIYFGLNLNAHFLNYTESTAFYESNDAPRPTNKDSEILGDLNFKNHLQTYGSGFSFQLGIIGKVSKNIRLGYSYQSPTWYHLNDELSQKITTTILLENKAGVYEIAPNVVNYYPTYDLHVPGKSTASFAYIFKKALISFDYGLKNYSNTSFKPSVDFTRVNNEMTNILREFTSDFRIGSEYKYNNWKFRGGYRYEQSPYKNRKTVGDLNSFSCGFGYNFGATKLDLAYTYSRKKSMQSFFNQGFTDGANINVIRNNIVATLLFEL